MSTTAPLTPVRNVGTNRSFTVPVRSTNPSHAQPTAEIGSAEGIETLYVHPNAKIVKFSSGTGSRPRSSSYGSPGAKHGGGTLPWATITEQTLAAGPLEIYRVPGSVSFLHSGSLLHAIMPRSNCWCVDGVSKFAMRVLTDTYYRIELPGESQEELERVEVFKETLKKVLFYERTPCPFARTFTVELPEEEKPVRRKRRSTHGPAKKWKLDRAYSWKPEDGREPAQSTSEEDSGSMSDEDEDDARATDTIPEDVAEDPELAARMKELAVQAPHWRAPPRPTVRDRVKGLSMRSVTAPVRSPAQAASPSRLKSSLSPESGIMSARGEPIEHRAYQSIPTDMPPSPPDSSAGFEQPQLGQGGKGAHAPTKKDGETSSYDLQQYETSLVSSAFGPPLAIDSENLRQLEETQNSTLPDPDVESVPGIESTQHAAASETVEETSTQVEELSTQVTLEDAAAQQEDSQHNDKTATITDEWVEAPPASPILVATSAAPDQTAENAPKWPNPVSAPSTPDLAQELVAAPRTPETSASVPEDINEALASLHIRTASPSPQDPTSESIAAPHTPINTPSPTDSPFDQPTQKSTSPPPPTKSDPFAQIQARILARRSIGGTTTSFHPPPRSPTRQFSSSTASSTTSSSSSLSRQRTTRPATQPPKKSQNAMAGAIARKTCAVLLGPPAHLVVLMLKIAARFARGVVPRSLVWRSPKGSGRRIPGSFDLDGSEVEGFWASEDEIAEFEDMEDDFGVRIGSPVSLAAGLRERRERSREE
ncbi:unnamed protein product [Zymoseptoria tritici ST99CH_3D7]|uniref:Inheritance of peroxisomes protein 1 n=1 Tax=Zymoseptoria tritici (strain ST99CH_3D7) TaxID=1276538 RepID=A0A1X7RXM8_ZYMT9|nr:unnamed protein product [Zymoseptoria tritici ST99CH_3D7]